MQIAIGLPIGYQAGAGGGLAEEYRIRDTFGTARAQGSVQGAPADPGPGYIAQITDAGNDINISGGVLNLPSQNERVWYNGVHRRPGLAMRWTVNTAALTNNGWADALGSIATTAHGIAIVPGNDIRFYDNNAFTVVGTYAGETAWCSILRAAGSMGFIYRSGNWLLLYFTASENAAVMYPSFATIASGALAVSLLAVPATRWLPAPLISDGFSVWATSDGLGHAEGIAGGMGSGGDGDAWTAVVGTWGAASGVASAALTSRAIATVDCGKADLIATVNCTRAGGTMSLIVRWVDESNHVQVRINGTNCALVKVVAGVTTTVNDAVYTHVDGAPLRLICSGDKFRRFYNNVAVGAEFTIADAVLQAPTVVGLRTDNAGNTFDNLTAFARGTGGEYNAVLDAI